MGKGGLAGASIIKTVVFRQSFNWANHVLSISFQERSQSTKQW